MSQRDWRIVPIYQQGGTPAAQTIDAEGLHIGYNLPGRDFMIIGENTRDFYKCAYYKDGSYYYLLVVCQDIPNVALGAIWYVSYTNSYGTIYHSTIARQDVNYPGLRYWNYIGQCSPDLRNFSIPSYDSEALALTALNDNVWTYDPDPYGGMGGASGTGGGTGTFSDTGDDISIPGLPTLSATNAGFITLYSPTSAELNGLAAYMWTNPLFDMTQWKKIFADPMDAILGLSIIPVSPTKGTAREVYIGNIGTGINLTPIVSQYVEVDCGSLNVQEYWGAYLDYSPYTKAEIYLPYIGVHPISTDDIMGKSVHVVYHVDILSGSCTAYVKCGGSVLYSFIGQCTSSIPVTGKDWTNVINGAINIATAIGSMTEMGGSSAPMLQSESGKSVNNWSKMGSIASTAVNTIKPSIEKSGSISGTGGLLGIQTPYLILSRPRQAVPSRQNSYIGYPSYITKTLSDLTGYTEVESIHLENMTATGEELDEIETLLKSGVIF